MKDVAGNLLAAPYSWSFSTAAAPSGGTTFTFGPAADTYVSQASPTSSYATSSSFSAVDGSTSAKQIYIRFNVSGLPAGAVVSAAKLRLYVTNDSTSGGIVQSVSDTTWAEALTWGGKPAIDGPVRATLGAVALNTLIEVDLGGRSPATAATASRSRCRRATPIPSATPRARTAPPPTTRSW